MRAVTPRLAQCWSSSLAVGLTLAKRFADHSCVLGQSETTSASMHLIISTPRTTILIRSLSSVKVIYYARKTLKTNQQNTPVYIYIFTALMTLLGSD